MKFNSSISDEQKDWIETIIGGACGVIAIAAAIIEFILGENGAIAGMIKDIFGTAVVVVLLIAATMPKFKPKNLTNILEQAVEQWGENNAPLIFKAEEYAQDSNFKQGFVLIQNPKEDYIPLLMKDISKGTSEWTRYAKYGRGNQLTGKFINMPSYDDMTLNEFKIMIYLEQSHFKNMSNIDTIVHDIENSITICCKPQIKAHKIGASHTIELICSQIKSVKDIDDFVENLDFILSLIKVIV